MPDGISDEMSGETARSPYFYEDEIDLRKYVEVLLRHWPWIVGCALVAAIVAFAVTAMMDPTYEASAVVLITEPRYQMQFEPRFETVDQWQPAYKAFPELATSDGVLEEVVAAYEPSPEAQIERWRLTALKGMVKASSEGDPSLVKLTVSCGSAEDAAALANVWAEKLVERGNEIYSEGEDDVTFFQEQTAQAEEALDDAEEALVGFRARDRASIVSAQLSSYRQTQSDYLADQRTIAYLVQDIEGLRDQMAQQPDDQPASLADDLTTLYLQVKAFNAEAATPIQLQVNSAESLSQKSRSEQSAFLADLVETLEAKSATIEERLTDLEPRILELQEELQTIETEEEGLKRAQTLAQETYMTLSRKLEEARIAAQEENGVLQVGSQAAVPENPSGPSKKVNTALAGAVGLMVGVFGVFVRNWWREDEEGAE
jgi:uncharacterized protein involved in exopolysaccharide biosynthesis